MKHVLAIMFCMGIMPVAWSQDKPKGPLHHGMSRHLAMMDAERDEYATHLATFAANQLAAEKADVSVDMIPRFLQVAKLLSPKNKRAVVVSYQWERKVKPEKVPGGFSATSLARLFFTRGKLLLDQEGGENQWAGRAFLRLAAEMDPKNEDAVYASELDEMENGVFEWESPSVN